jgi:hypothetical protein
VRSLLAPAIASHVAEVSRERPGADSASSANAAEAALRGGLELPAFAPPISTAHVGEDGALWLRREDRGEPFFRWVLLDAQGTSKGQVDVPRNVSIHWTSGNTVWASWLDELNVPWLVRYSLVAGG